MKRVTKFLARGLKAVKYLTATLWNAGFSRMNLDAVTKDRVHVARRFSARVVLLLLGSTLMSMGISMTIVSALGVGPADVFITGIANVSGLSVAIAAYFYTAISILGVLLAGRRPTIGGMVLSVTVSSWLFVLPGWIVPPPGQAGQWLFLLGGLLALVLGVEMAAAANFGRGTTEILVEAIAERSDNSERLIRTILEASMLVTGIILGGQIGIGTVTVAVLIGPLLQAVAQGVSDYQDGRAARILHAQSSSSEPTNS